MWLSKTSDRYTYVIFILLLLKNNCFWDLSNLANTAARNIPLQIGLSGRCLISKRSECKIEWNQRNCGKYH